MDGLYIDNMNLIHSIVADEVAGTDFLEELFVLLDEFPRCAGTDQGYGCVAVPGFGVFPEVQIGANGRIIEGIQKVGDFLNSNSNVKGVF